MKILIKTLQTSLLTFLIWSCNNSDKPKVLKTKSSKTKIQNTEVKKSIPKKVEEINFEKLINEIDIAYMIRGFGIEIENIDYNNYKVIIRNDTITLTKETYETIQGKIVKSYYKKINNARIKIEFGYNQYTIDDIPSQPLKFSKSTKWINLKIENNSVEIPELYNNSNSLKIYELLGLKNNAEIQKWIKKNEVKNIKKLSISKQNEVYSKILKEKEKYEKCCPEYIKQAINFTNRKKRNEIQELNIELIVKRIIIELTANNNGKKYKRVIIEN